MPEHLFLITTHYFASLLVRGLVHLRPRLFSFACSPSCFKLRVPLFWYSFTLIDSLDPAFIGGHTNPRHTSALVHIFPEAIMRRFRQAGLDSHTKTHLLAHTQIQSKIPICTCSPVQTSRNATIWSIADLPPRPYTAIHSHDHLLWGTNLNIDTLSSTWSRRHTNGPKYKQRGTHNFASTLQNRYTFE